MTPSSIWIERQNTPSLIVDDLKSFVPTNTAYEILLRRGVFKWLSARRKIIKLKNIWKERVTASLERQKLRYGPDVNYERGYRRALEECRAELREICHGPRWEAPDNDHRAQVWLEWYGEEKHG